jgi:peptide/nickel transport system permease protein
MRNLRIYFSRWQNLLAWIIITFFVVVALLAPWLAPPEDPADVATFRVVKELKGQLPFAPNDKAVWGTIATSILGTQIDVFYTIIWGTRSALRFGLFVALSTAILGVLVGAASGFAGGWINNLTMRITDAFLAFPLIVSVVLFRQLLAIVLNPPAYSPLLPPVPNSLGAFIARVDPLMLAFVLFLWMPYARVTNAMVLNVKRTDFVQAAQAMGAGSVRIIIRHLIPNSISPAIVLAARDIGLVVLLQATLTFIGIGGNSEWGALLDIGRRWIIGQGGNPLIYWWVFIPATLALVLFGVGWNLLGDGLNDWLDPRQATL